MISFEELDDIFKDLLPKDLVGEVFEFYDTRCQGCSEEMISCEDCEYYFCQIHICFRHKVCSICRAHACPYKKFERICSCHQNMLCEDCYYNDERLIFSLLDPPIPPPLSVSLVDSLIFEIEEFIHN